MNSWFDYGFTPAQFSAAQPTYPLQFAPAVGAYARQPFPTSGVLGIGYTMPYYGLSPVTPYGVPPPYGVGPLTVFGGLGLPAPAWPGFQEPSTLRPIGFQPSIAGAGNVPQFQQVLGRIPSDDEIEDLISEALEADPLLSGNAEVEVRCESGQVTLTGHVQHRSIKRAIGELAWSVPGIVDVQNNLELSSRRRIRAAGLRKDNPQVPGQPRK